MQKKVALLDSVGSLIAQENICSGQAQSSLHRGHLCKKKKKKKTTIVTLTQKICGLKIVGAMWRAECTALYGKFVIFGQYEIHSLDNSGRKSFNSNHILSEVVME